MWRRITYCPYDKERKEVEEEVLTTKVIEPKTKIGRIGLISARYAMKGAAMEPILAMEQAKERATERMTVGKSSLVYR